MAEADPRATAEVAHSQLLVPGGRGAWGDLQLGRSASADGLFTVGDGTAQFDDEEDVRRCGAAPWPAGSDQLPGVSPFQRFGELREVGGPTLAAVALMQDPT